MKNVVFILSLMLTLLIGSCNDQKCYYYEVDNTKIECVDSEQGRASLNEFNKEIKVVMDKYDNTKISAKSLVNDLSLVVEKFNHKDIKGTLILTRFDQRTALKEEVHEFEMEFAK